MKTVIQAGCEADLFASSLSANQDCTEITSDAHPMYLLRVNIAAMGSAVLKAAVTWVAVSLVAGSSKGTTERY
jgi:hypothetical protein